MEAFLNWMKNHADAMEALHHIGLLVVAVGAIWMAARRLKLADQRDKREEQTLREQREQHAAEQERRRGEQYEERCARFARAAAKLRDDSRVENRDWDNTQALQEIEAIAEADPEHFMRRAKGIVRDLDRKFRFPTRKAVEEYDRENAEATAEWEREEADAEYQEWKEVHHRPYEDDEPRISGLDLSYIFTVKRLGRVDEFMDFW